MGKRQKENVTKMGGRGGGQFAKNFCRERRTKRKKKNRGNGGPSGRQNKFRETVGGGGMLTELGEGTYEVAEAMSTKIRGPKRPTSKGRMVIINGVVMAIRKN